MEMNEKIEYAADGAEVTPVPSKRDMKRAFSRMALGLCLGLLVSQLVPGVLQAAVPGFDNQAHAFLVGGLCTGLFTLPLLLLLTRQLSTGNPDKRRLSIGRFFALVAISYACMIVGNLVGIGVNSLLSPNSVNLVGELATAAGMSAETVIAFVVLAPVFEELVFRKVIVDRVLPFGEWPAILFSGITFGYIPTGSGNDFGRSMHLPVRPMDALEIIFSPSITQGPASRKKLCRGDDSNSFSISIFRLFY